MFELMPFRRRRNAENVPATTFDLMERMDRLFDDIASSFFQTAPMEVREWVPAFDVSETDDNIIIKADIPGIDPKDLDISIAGNVLTIKGERKQEQEEKNENYHRIERSYGTFRRSMTLPANVDGDKIQASYKDGVVRLTIPKTESSKPKKIEVKRD